MAIMSALSKLELIEIHYYQSSMLERKLDEKDATFH